jgi:hypothetical protein
LPPLPSPRLEIEPQPEREPRLEIDPAPPEREPPPEIDRPLELDSPLELDPPLGIEPPPEVELRVEDEPRLEIDPAPRESEPRLEIDPSGSFEIAPRLEIDPPPPAAEEEVLALPPDCIEETPDDALPVVQGQLAEDDAAEEEVEAEAVAEEEAEAEGPAEVLDYGEHPRPVRPRRPQRRKADRQPFRAEDRDRVNLGLGFHYARIAVMLAGVALLFVGLAVGTFVAVVGSAQARQGHVSKGTIVSVGLVWLVFALVGFTFRFVTPLLGLAGSSLCMWVPLHTGAWGCMLASLILDAVATLVSLLLLLPGLVSSSEGAALAALPAFLLSLAAWVLFVIALYRLSVYLKEEKMAEEAVQILQRGIAILILTPLVLFALVALAGSCVGALFSPPIALYSLYYLFFFLRRQLDLVGSLRQVIASRG